MWWLNFFIISLLIMAILVCLLGIKIANLREKVYNLERNLENERCEIMRKQKEKTNVN